MWKIIAPKRDPDGQSLQKAVSRKYQAAANERIRTMNFVYHTGLTLRFLPCLKWLIRSCNAPNGHAQPQSALPNIVP